MKEESMDRAARLLIYRGFIEDGYPPTSAELALELSVSIPDVESSLSRLHATHAIVLVGGSSYVLMANPFSALRTAFTVTAGQRRWWGNCIWDAVAIPMMLGIDARIDTWCPDCAEPMSLRIEDERPSNDRWLAHFAVPARHFWDDIGFT